jgi:methylase of polypeptide subunit release factors
MALALKQKIRTSVGLELLTSEQREQVLRQIRYHLEGPAYEEIVLADAVTLSCQIEDGVTRPMSSKLLSRWLWENRARYQGGRVLDVGTGSGVQALTCAIGGAASVCATDVTDSSVRCSSLNVHRAGVTEQVRVVKSDVFDEIAERTRFDLIVFAQPYFEGDPLADYEFTVGMLNADGLLSKFFSGARAFLAPRGKIVMMHWPFAGTANDPAVVGPSYGFEIEETVPSVGAAGVQEGEFNIVVLV